ncbi:DNA-deoxyinosine glycosylase [Marinobacterium litorale]|uniref:DNA-deoxyinosine glycosylase n=1 Tax=Marinobacterium litorale TaxID=404770 RepID=UPI000429C0F3|nr:DNA-deoxyinosine glycosylase [Marinobacterium litorale]
MTEAVGFPPSWRRDARVLILGSMPGRHSLAATQYYAHPRNAFWPIMTRLFQWPDDLSYEARLRALQKERVALWDVIERCKRPGSLDSRIESNSVQDNDLAALVAQMPALALIACNGGLAYRSVLRRWRGPLEQVAGSGLEICQLPSTSPAHASLSIDQKCEHWAMIKRYLT